MIINILFIKINIISINLKKFIEYRYSLIILNNNE